jgi:hypothetical protein
MRQVTPEADIERSAPAGERVDLHKMLTGEPLSPNQATIQHVGTVTFGGASSSNSVVVPARGPSGYKVLLGDLKHRHHVRLPVSQVSPYGLFGGVGVAMFDRVQNLDVVIHVILPGRSAFAPFQRYVVAGFGDAMQRVDERVEQLVS